MTRRISILQSSAQLHFSLVISSMYCFSYWSVVTFCLLVLLYEHRKLFGIIMTLCLILYSVGSIHWNARWLETRKCAELNLIRRLTPLLVMSQSCGGPSS